ncbi:SNAP25 homologous protein SNAP29-like [Chenopodium quinoa]|uniref:SNAP25 homologous protein SNAP29-like n=1 Tax=Chenopodium quinoa TaxID=63459 RepID=UPI000B795919|nr:SNAP25 homologous protein SNAP29-like [Chenopodium quinoa]
MRVCLCESELSKQELRNEWLKCPLETSFSRGKKLLGSLGGLFSRTSEPKKTAPVNGPVILRVQEYDPTNAPRNMSWSGLIHESLLASTLPEHAVLFSPRQVSELDAAAV